MKELTAKEIKNEELNMLLFIDKTCRKNNINYSLDCGTMLGCVRHGGFIPWDDDIDIAISKYDYQRFKDIINKDERYKIMDAFDNNDYHYPFAKVIDTKTKLIEDGVYPIDGLGLYIDVFTKYPVSNNYFLRKLMLIRLQLRVYVCYFTSYKSYENRIYNIISKVFRKFLSGNKASRDMMIIASKQDKDKDRCISLANIKRKVNYQHYMETIEKGFEGYNLFIPKEYDAVLKNHYGDYMKLPPKEKQVSVHDYKAYYKY